MPDLVFGIVLWVGLFAGRTAFLNDPGTYWHAELGRQIAQTGLVPRADTFTYTRPGAPWVDQSWAFDLGLAAVVDRWGWSGAVAATALALAWIYATLARSLGRAGISPLAATGVAVLAAAIGSIHFLTRPHVLTFAFVLWTLDVCRGYHRSGDARLWWLPLGVAAWANVHGGFLAGPLIVATAAIGHAAEGPWDAQHRRRLGGFVAVFVLCLLAPLANPYGLGLYRHVFELLVSSGVTKLINEYQPSPFGQVEALVLEWFVLALIALPCFSRNRLSRYELAHIVVWLHFALGQVRQAPLFAIAAAPGLAGLVDGLLSPSEDPGRDRERSRWSIWPVVASLAMAATVALGVRWGGPSPKWWPLQALPVVNRQPAGLKMFHDQDWGGLIESECRPRRRTFLDDRFELYGRRAILDYLEALRGGPGWDALDGREHFELAWVRAESGLGKRLAADRGWQVLHRDKVSVLLRRGPAGSSSAP